jgi:hypothetical protein
MNRGPWLRSGRAWLLPAALLPLAACSDPDPVPRGCDGQPVTVQSKGEVAVYSDRCALERQMVRTHEDVPIDPPLQMLRQGLVAAAPPSATLTLLATVSPPVVRGMTLQAASVTLRNDYAVVSYMIRGEPAAGGLDVIDTSREDRPELISRATFDYSDITAADFDEGYVWFVGATPNQEPLAPAFLQAMRMHRGVLDTTGTERAAMLSYVGTSVSVANQAEIYATSGSQGSFVSYSYASGSFVKRWEHSMQGARGVHYRADRIAVVTGVPGSLSVYNKTTGAALGTYSVSGADVAEAKTTVEVADQKAFIAAGTAGVQVLNLNSGQLVASLAPPNAASLGLSPSVVVTNGVSVDGNLVFACNGEAGISVASGASTIDSGGTLTMLGQLRLGDANSANHVAFRGRYLMIATGLGGLKIVKVETN